MIEKISFEQITLLVAFVLACIAAYNAIMTAVKNAREEKKHRESPVTQLTERVSKHDTMLANDKKRIDDLDQRITDINRQSVITLRGVRALLSHEVNGNSVDRLKDSLTEIDNYLIERK